MKPLTQPLADLDKLIDNREDQINALFIENEKLRTKIAANLDKIKAHEAEIDAARAAHNKLSAILG